MKVYYFAVHDSTKQNMNIRTIQALIQEKMKGANEHGRS